MPSTRIPPVSRTSDLFITALTPILWGSTYLVTTLFLPMNTPFITATLRILPAGLLILCYLRTLPSRALWGKIILLSLLNMSAFQALLFISIHRLPGGLAAILNSTAPLVVILLIYLVDRIKPSYLALLSAISGSFGIALIVLSDKATYDLWGMVAGLLSAVCIACGGFLQKRWTLPLPILALTGWQLTLGGLFLIPLAILQNESLPTFTLSTVLGYAYLSLLGTLLAYFLWFRGLSRLPQLAVASLGLLSPLTANFLGWVFLGQIIKGSALIGAIIVLISIVGMQIKPKS